MSGNRSARQRRQVFTEPVRTMFFECDQSFPGRCRMNRPARANVSRRTHKMFTCHLIQYQHRVVDRNLERRCFAGLVGQSPEYRAGAQAQIVARQRLHTERHQSWSEPVRSCARISIEQFLAIQRLQEPVCRGLIQARQLADVGQLQLWRLRRKQL